MSCPTCDHTMASLGENVRGDIFFLCPRCGTVKVDAFGQHGDKTYVPKLVERCREFARRFHEPICLPSADAGDWIRLGIAESISAKSEG